MAKSKAVKQAEALERKRKLYPQKLDLSARSRFGGDLYDKVLVARGKEAADENNKHAQLLFSKYLKEAQLNADGTETIYAKGSLGKEIHYGRQHIYEHGVDSVLEEFIVDQTTKSISQAVADVMKATGQAQPKDVSIEPYHQVE